MDSRLDVMATTYLAPVWLPRDRLATRGEVETIAAILEAVFHSGEPELLAGATNLINELGSRGHHGFRALLKSDNGASEAS